MIKGMTHNEDGTQNKITKYRGKISAGYGPGEGPEKKNYPTASGFFRMMKEVTKNQRLGASTTIVPVKEWVVNDEVQKKLVASCNNNPQPRRIEICCLYKEPAEMWESSLSMYSQNDGLICKGHGLGSTAKHLVFEDGDRRWEPRECLFEECPDYKSGKCKATGLLKCFPTIDLAPNPYRFETRSINTVIGIESSLSDLMSLVHSAHLVKQMEAGSRLPFDGLFGAKFFLVHRKAKSGGKNIFITDLMPTPEFTESVMEPIRRGLLVKAKNSKLIGAAGSMSLLQEAGHMLLEAGKSSAEIAETDAEGAVPLDLDDQRDLAVNFNSGDDEEVVEVSEVQVQKESTSVPEDISRKAVEALMGDQVTPAK